MQPQPRSVIKPDPTMLLCYVPDLVFTLIRDGHISSRPEFRLMYGTIEGVRHKAQGIR